MATILPHEHPDLVNVDLGGGQVVPILKSVVANQGLYNDPGMEPPAPAAEKLAQADPFENPQPGGNLFTPEEMQDFPKVAAPPTAQPGPARVRAASSADLAKQAANQAISTASAYKSQRGYPSEEQLQRELETHIGPEPPAYTMSRGVAPKFQLSAQQEAGPSKASEESIRAAHNETEAARGAEDIEQRLKAPELEAQSRELAMGEALAAQQEADRAKERQIRQHAFETDFANRQAQLDKSLSTIANEPSAREKVWQDKGWFGRILAGLSLVLGAGVKVAYGVNPAEDILNKQVKDETDHQQRQLDVLNMQTNRLAQLRQYHNDTALSNAQLELELRAAQDAKLRAFARSTDSANLRDQIEQILAKRATETAQLNEQFEMGLAHQLQSTYGWTKGSPGGIAPNPAHKKWQEAENQYLETRQKKQQALGQPQETAENVRNAQQDIMNRSVVYNGQNLYITSTHPEVQKEVQEQLRSNDTMNDVLNRAKDLAEQIRGNKISSESAAKLLARYQRELRQVTNQMRIQGHYMTPNAADFENIGKDMGELGQGLASGHMLGAAAANMLGQIEANADELRRISDRNTKIYLNHVTSTDPNPYNIVRPKFQEPDVAPSPGARQ